MQSLFHFIGKEQQSKVMLNILWRVSKMTVVLYCIISSAINLQALPLIPLIALEFSPFWNGPGI